MGFTVETCNDINNRVFLDRDDILESIEENVRKYNDHEFFRLVVFYGMGGIGKSRLINKIYDIYRDGRCNVYRFPLEILNHETIPSILLCIRERFDYTPHFDYALCKYWEFISYGRVDRESLYSVPEKLIVRLGKLFDAAVGQGLLNTEQLIGKIIVAFEARTITDAEKEKVSNLLQGKIEDLYIHLAQVLAKDIESILDKQKYMFLFDAYDLGRSSYKFDWLKHFINSFENGMFFVTSRELLDWFNNPLVDKNAVKCYALDCIPPEKVNEYLATQHYTQAQIDFIIEKTKCIPLYLDLAMQVNKEESVSINAFIAFNSKNDLIRNFLSHFSADEQVIIDYLSVVKIFNATIYEYAVRFNNSSLLKYSFYNFQKSTIIRYVENYNELYKIHSVLAENIAYFVDPQIRAKIIIDYLITIHARIIPDECLPDDTKYTLIINIYSLLENEKIIILEQQSEQLIDFFLYLLDRGYGNDFYHYIVSVTNRKQSNLFYIYQYIIGKMIRGSNIAAGLKCLQSIPMDACNFGKHKKSLTCDINYILSISGKYLEAETAMRKFADALKDSEKNESYYIKGMIYNLDMQMLRGKFKSATLQLELLSNDVSNEKLSYEIQKAIGHCYRFNFLFDTALMHYKKGGESIFNMSYYYTVCCETYCYYEPQKVFDLYDKAIKENEKYNNHNNLGKIYYSMAIANAISHNIYQAKRYIKMAHAKFNHTKYYAGNLFTFMAEVYIEYSQTKDVSSKTIVKIKKYINKINNIYSYLLLPIYIIKDNHKIIDHFKYIYEWFDYDSTLKNIKSFLAQL